jgi:hypothetical protein
LLGVFAQSFPDILGAEQFAEGVGRDPFAA